jgi:hypothetical protein
MARALFKELFSVDELKSHSLNGRKCNADKTEIEPLPQLDLVRKDAIIGKLLTLFYAFAMSIDRSDNNSLLFDYRIFIETLRT